MNLIVIEILISVYDFTLVRAIGMADQRFMVLHQFIFERGW